jgi:hypothetical protein
MLHALATHSNFNFSIGGEGAAQTEPHAHQIIPGKEGEHHTIHF